MDLFRFHEKISNITSTLAEDSPVRGAVYCAAADTLLPCLADTCANRAQFVFLDAAAAMSRQKKALIRIGTEARDTYSLSLPHTEYPIAEAIRTCHRLLSGSGTAAVACGSNASAEVRTALDSIFGKQNFLNEIVWHFKGGAGARSCFAKRHEIIYLYAKSGACAFSPLAVGELRGNERRNHMKRAVDSDGRAYFFMQTGEKEYRYYEDELVPFDDVWDIPAVNIKTSEHTGIDGQRPLELFERLLSCTTEKGDLAVQLFSGAGTLAVAAANTGRHFLAADDSALSLHTLRRRLLAGRLEQLELFKDSLPDNSAIVNLNAVRRTGTLEITVNSYSHRSLALLPKRASSLDYLSYVACGHLTENGCFLTEDYAVPSGKTPFLQDGIRLSPAENNAVYLVDCLGNEKLILLDG